MPGQIDTVSLGAEDLEQNTIATTIQGSITGMPSFRYCLATCIEEYAGGHGCPGDQASIFSIMEAIGIY
jgi:hypothetical protein